MVSPDYRAAIHAIKDARMNLEISQRELARRLGKSPSFVNKIEQLERRLDIVEFIAIAKALEIAPDKLIALVAASLNDPVSI